MGAGFSSLAVVDGTHLHAGRSRRRAVPAGVQRRGRCAALEDPCRPGLERRVRRSARDAQRRRRPRLRRSAPRATWSRPRPRPARSVWRRSLPDRLRREGDVDVEVGESPLVDGDRVIVTPGAAAAGLVALDKATGKEIWRSAIPELGPAGKDGAGYSSVVISNASGVKQYVQLMGRGLVGVRASDGKFLWGYNRVANGVANIPTPIVRANWCLLRDRLPDRRGSRGAVEVAGRGRAGARDLLPRAQDVPEPPRRHGARRQPRLRRQRPQQGLPDLHRVHDRQGGLGRRHPQRGHRLGRRRLRRRPPLLPLPERRRDADPGDPRGLPREGLVHDPGRGQAELVAPGDRRAAGSTCASRTRSTSTTCARRPERDVRVSGPRALRGLRCCSCSRPALSPSPPRPRSPAGRATPRAARSPECASPRSISRRASSERPRAARAASSCCPACRSGRTRCGPRSPDSARWRREGSRSYWASRPCSRSRSSSGRPTRSPCRRTSPGSRPAAASSATW